jgi:putative holliday junction resolvase
VRALGIDLGTRRLGVALSDSAGSLATPYEVVERSGDRSRDHRRIAELVEEAGAEIVVVGLPLSLDGSAGPAARAALDEAEELRATLGVPVEEWDERFTTVTAHQGLIASGVRGPARRKVVDKVAASVMLQAWLDHRRATGRGGGEDDQR